MKKILLSSLITLAACAAALYFYTKEEITMAMVYVSLIIKGRRTFSSVPKLLKKQVAEILIDLELEYLIDDPEYLPTEE